MSFLGFGTSKTKNKNKHPLEKTKKNLEKKRKTSVETENIVSGRKVVFLVLPHFFSVFLFPREGVWFFGFGSQKKQENSWKKYVSFHLCFFGFSKCASMTNQKNGISPKNIPNSKKAAAVDPKQ